MPSFMPGTCIGRRQLTSYTDKADLESGRFSSIEKLATTANLHPKVVRQALRLALSAGNLVVRLKINRIDAPRRVPLQRASHQYLDE
jgi:hypothetical protein